MRYALLLLLAGCAASPAPGRDGFHSSSASIALEQGGLEAGRRGPAVYTPTNQIATPAAGVSRVCTPDPSGFGSTCRSLD